MKGDSMMIEHDDVELLWPLGHPTSLQAMKEQVTLVKGWTQLVARYSVEEWPWHEQDVRHRRSSLIDAAARAAVLALDWPTDPMNVLDDEPAAGTEWLPVYASMLGAPRPPVRHTRERSE